ncbi:MAG: hypothetical protein ACFFFB_20775 [Candidatus Heimdallarchaeota archaeon]
MSNVKQPIADNKIQIDIYVPLNVCACQWESFMNRIFQVLMKYNKYVKFETKNLDSNEARNLNLRGNCVVINRRDVVTSSFALKRKLSEILKERGMI